MRSATASLLGRLMAQPLHGPRVALLVGRVLPPGLVAALADGPGDAALTVSSGLARGSQDGQLQGTRARHMCHVA